MNKDLPYKAAQAFLLPQFRNLLFNVAERQIPKGAQVDPYSGLSVLPNYWHQRTYSAALPAYLHTLHVQIGQINGLASPSLSHFEEEDCKGAVQRTCERA